MKLLGFVVVVLVTLVTMLGFSVGSASAAICVEAGAGPYAVTVCTP